MKEKSLDDIVAQIRECKIDYQFDLIVGIANGGIVPSYLLAHHLGKPLDFIWINFRDIDNNPQHQSPMLLKPVSFDFRNKSILLVDDRIVTGKTFNFAIELLNGAKNIKTFSINGKADFYLFDEECFDVPWDI